MKVIISAILLASAFLHARRSVDADGKMCKDDQFYLDPAIRGSFGQVSCPEGYQPARLNDPATFTQAAMFIFGCLGPGHEAWISTAMGTVYAQGDPIKLRAPDAIEKGAAGPARLTVKTGTIGKVNQQQQRHTRRKSMAKEKVYVPPSKIPVRRSTVQELPQSQPSMRTTGIVLPDSSEAVLPFLCQLSPTSNNNNRIIKFKHRVHLNTYFW